VAPVIETKKLTKRFSPFLADDNVGLPVEKNEIHGLDDRTYTGSRRAGSRRRGVPCPASGPREPEITAKRKK
jgi:hypothetical protein